MAHTDRDDDRWASRNHHRYECPNAYRIQTVNGWHCWASQGCLICDTETRARYWCSTEGKGGWNRTERQTERAKAKRALRQCRDYDALSIKYHRPYWD